MDLTFVVDELYGASPKEFTARRSRLAREASQDGDRALAEAVKGLRRPTTSAWLVNTLARQAGDGLAEYLDLGRRLREAQAGLAGDQIRLLSHRRQQLAADLVAAAARLAGQPLGEQTVRELEETLRAAVADPRAGQAVASGRLTRALSYAGLGEIDISAATATPLVAAKAGPRRPGPQPRAQPAPQRRPTPGSVPESGPGPGPGREAKPTPEPATHPVAQLRAADERLAAAQSAADAAHAANGDAQGLLAHARDHHERLGSRIDELRRQLAAARLEMAAAKDEIAGAERAQRAAARDELAAQRDLLRARRHLDTVRAGAAPR